MARSKTVWVPSVHTCADYPPTYIDSKQWSKQTNILPPTDTNEYNIETKKITNLAPTHRPLIVTGVKA